jgi:nucleoside-diphosphate-sugar epimerase
VRDAKSTANRMHSQQNAVLILGCGYTGQRVARRLLEKNIAVTATSRDPGQLPLRRLSEAGAKILRFDINDRASFAALQREVQHGMTVLHSLPTIGDRAASSDPTPAVLELLGDSPSRIVLLSTTGVYGNAREVDEKTPPAPATERQKLRLAAEEAVRAGSWRSLTVRASAIYGPGRGVHVRMKEGRFKLLGDGSNYISRIHVDDLAAITVAALHSEATGAYPAADAEPCRSAEICAFCAKLLGLPMPPPAAADELDETRRSDRRVDGRAILRLLGVALQYPSYRTGIPASLDSSVDGMSGPSFSERP